MEDVKIKMDPKQDIIYKAACERQRKYWADKLPTLTDEQIAIIMESIAQVTNLVTALDMSDGIRSQVPFRSKLGNSMRLVLELLTAPEPPKE